LRADKRLTLILFLLAFTGLGVGEVVKLSRLQAPPRELSIQRDLFRPGRGAAPVRQPIRPAPSALQRRSDIGTPAVSPVDRIRRNIVYEGFIRRGGKLTAIISVNGEYFVVVQAEVVVDTVAVAELDEKRLVVTVDGERFEVPFQGVEEK